MMRVSTSRLAATLLCAAVVSTACGQKPGVHVENAPGGAPVVAEGGGQTSAPTTGGTVGNGADDDDGGAVAAPGTGTSGGGGTTTGGASQGGGTAPNGSGGQADQPADAGDDSGPTAAPDGGDDGGGDTPDDGQQSGQRQPTGSDRTGVSDDTIRIAVHAPVTGAAPLPSESFREARDLYWLWKLGKNGGTALGRENVEVIFADDKYSPENARQVCRQLAAEAFVVAGGGGTDQIQTCGELSGRMGFPYFSPGVTEAGLQGNPWYFASSMTYRQQGILLAQYLKRHFGDKKIAMIVTDTGNFRDAEDGFVQGAQQQGLDFFDGSNPRILRHPKGDTSWYSTFARQLDGDGVEVIYILSSPVDYIQFAQQANQSQYGPFQYVGVGVTMGLNAVLGNGCPDVDGGRFFSPFPGLDVAREAEPEFFQAAQEFGKVADDLALALWGLNKGLDLMWQRYEEVYGTDLTREDFRAVVESIQGLETGLFPRVSYSPNNHFGGEQVHVLQADCGTGEHVTLETFKSSF